MDDDQQFDGLFYNVMQGAKGIDNFFDKCFGFFRRKTDYFGAPGLFLFLKIRKSF